MKHINKLFAVIALFIGFNSHAQENKNKWAITLGANAVDTRVSAATKVEDQFSQYFNVKDNWNILPSVSYLTVTRSIGGRYTFGVTGSINKIKKFVNPKNMDYTVVNPGDLNYYGLDGIIQYSFMQDLGSKWFDPYAHIGGGYTWIGDSSYGTVNGGLGLTIWFTQKFGLSLQSTYKYSLEASKFRGAPDNLPTHMQHFAGLTYRFGRSDKDGDGIYDNQDKCIDVPGLKQFKGCPDTDGDGIVDASDSCPEIPGIAEFEGCPDTDGDGIADKDDECPQVAGPKSLIGCPDADGDGIADKSDKCPQVAGPVANIGCPWPDTDGDGILDKDDKCIDVKGTVANYGCPEISQDQINQLNAYAKTILFDSSQSSFKEETFAVLQSITAILKQYPSSNFSIEGHADSDGKNDANQKLSEERAGAVKTYLIENGIDSSRLSLVGYGESKPMSSNKTAKGKAENRRVEVKLVK